MGVKCFPIRHAQVGRGLAPAVSPSVGRGLAPAALLFAKTRLALPANGLLDRRRDVKPRPTGGRFARLAAGQHSPLTSNAKNLKNLIADMLQYLSCCDILKIVYSRREPSLYALRRATPKHLQSLVRCDNSLRLNPSKYSVEGCCAVLREQIFRRCKEKM